MAEGRARSGRSSGRTAVASAGGRAALFHPEQTQTQEKSWKPEKTRLDAAPAPFTFGLDDRKLRDYSQFSEWKSGTNCSSLSGT